MKNQSALMIVGGGAALAIGSFLAWATERDFSVSGIDGGDGWFTLVGSAVVVVYGITAYRGKSMFPKWLAWAGLFVGVGVALINFFDILGINGASIGIGMWLMLVGGTVALFGLLRKGS